MKELQYLYDYLEIKAEEGDIAKLEKLCILLNYTRGELSFLEDPSAIFAVSQKDSLKRIGILKALKESYDKIFTQTSSDQNSTNEVKAGFLDLIKQIDKIESPAKMVAKMQEKFSGYYEADDDSQSGWKFCVEDIGSSGGQALPDYLISVVKNGIFHGSLHLNKSKNKHIEFIINSNYELDKKYLPQDDIIRQTGSKTNSTLTKTLQLIRKRAFLSDDMSGWLSYYKGVDACRQLMNGDESLQGIKGALCNKLYSSNLQVADSGENKLSVCDEGIKAIRECEEKLKRSGRATEFEHIIRKMEIKRNVIEDFKVACDLAREIASSNKDMSSFLTKPTKKNLATILNRRIITDTQFAFLFQFVCEIKIKEVDSLLLEFLKKCGVVEFLRNVKTQDVLDDIVLLWKLKDYDGLRKAINKNLQVQIGSDAFIDEKKKVLKQLMQGVVLNARSKTNMDVAEELSAGRCIAFMSPKEINNLYTAFNSADYSKFKKNFLEIVGSYRNDNISFKSEDDCKKLSDIFKQVTADVICKNISETPIKFKPQGGEKDPLIADVNGAAAVAKLRSSITLQSPDALKRFNRCGNIKTYIKDYNGLVKTQPCKRDVCEKKFEKLFGFKTTSVNSDVGAIEQNTSSLNNVQQVPAESVGVWDAIVNYYPQIEKKADDGFFKKLQDLYGLLETANLLIAAEYRADVNVLKNADCHKLSEYYKKLQEDIEKIIDDSTVKELITKLGTDKSRGKICNIYKHFGGKKIRKQIDLLTRCDDVQKKLESSAALYEALDSASKDPIKKIIEEKAIIDARSLREAKNATVTTLEKLRDAKLNTGLTQEQQKLRKKTIKECEGRQKGINALLGNIKDEESINKYNVLDFFKKSSAEKYPDIGKFALHLLVSGDHLMIQQTLCKIVVQTVEAVIADASEDLETKTIPQEIIALINGLLNLPADLRLRSGSSYAALEDATVMRKLHNLAIDDQNGSNDFYAECSEKYNSNSSETPSNEVILKIQKCLPSVDTSKITTYGDLMKEDGDNILQQIRNKTAKPQSCEEMLAGFLCNNANAVLPELNLTSELLDKFKVVYEMTQLLRDLGWLCRAKKNFDDQKFDDTSNFVKEINRICKKQFNSGQDIFGKDGAMHKEVIEKCSKISGELTEKYKQLSEVIDIVLAQTLPTTPLLDLLEKYTKPNAKWEVSADKITNLVFAWNSRNYEEVQVAAKKMGIKIPSNEILELEKKLVADILGESGVDEVRTRSHNDIKKLASAFYKDACNTFGVMAVRDVMDSFKKIKITCLQKNINSIYIKKFVSYMLQKSSVTYGNYKGVQKQINDLNTNVSEADGYINFNTLTDRQIKPFASLFGIKGKNDDVRSYLSSMYREVVTSDNSSNTVSTGETSSNNLIKNANENGNSVSGTLVDAGDKDSLRNVNNGLNSVESDNRGENNKSGEQKNSQNPQAFFTVNNKNDISQCGSNSISKNADGNGNSDLQRNGNNSLNHNGSDESTAVNNSQNPNSLLNQLQSAIQKNNRGNANTSEQGNAVDLQQKQ